MALWYISINLSNGRNLQFGNSVMSLDGRENLHKPKRKKQEVLSPPILKIATERVVMQYLRCPQSSVLPLLGTSPTLQGTPQGGPEPNAMTWHGLFLREINLGLSPAWQQQVCAMPNCYATAAEVWHRGGKYNKTKIRLCPQNSSAAPRYTAEPVPVPIQSVNPCIHKSVASFSIWRTMWSQNSEELILAASRNLSEISQGGICHWDSWLHGDLWHCSHGSRLMSLPGV